MAACWGAFVSLVSGAFAAGVPDGYTSLFDMKTLRGWKSVGGAVFRVDRGTILGETGDGKVGWLVTEKTYGDFILELEVKPELRGNSGIQIRSHLTEEGRMVGLQIEIDSSDRAWSGGLYDEGRRGWLQNLEDNPKGRKAFKFGRWNRYRVACVGDSIKSWVNGVPVADAVDSVDLEGIIALQVHGGQNSRVRWRNIRIRDLGRHCWAPLWDGKTLAGWRVLGGGSWNIEDGARGPRRSSGSTSAA